MQGLCCSLAASYRHLQLLRAGRGSGPAVVIAAQELPAAVATAERHGLAEPTPAGNKVLLSACAAGDDGAFLCLRCLVSDDDLPALDETPRTAPANQPGLTLDGFSPPLPDTLLLAGALATTWKPPPGAVVVGVCV